MNPQQIVRILYLIIAASVSVVSSAMPHTLLKLPLFLITLCALSTYISILLKANRFHFLHDYLTYTDYGTIIIIGLLFYIYSFFAHLLLSSAYLVTLVFILPMLSISLLMCNFIGFYPRKYWRTFTILLRDDWIKTLVYSLPLGIMTSGLWVIFLASLVSWEGSISPSISMIIIKVFFWTPIYALGYYASVWLLCKDVEDRHSTLHPLWEDAQKATVIHNEKEQVGRSVTYYLLYSINLCFLVLSPFLSILFYFMGAVHGVQINLVQVGLIIWFVWLLASLYFILMRNKDLTTGKVLFLFVLLCCAMYFFYFAQVPPPQSF
jgi:hypothetical protein